MEASRDMPVLAVGRVSQYADRHVARTAADGSGKTGPKNKGANVD